MNDSGYRLCRRRAVPGLRMAAQCRKAAAVYAALTEAAKMHAAMGAKVNIYQEGGGTGKGHYVLSFGDWAGMADFGDKVNASEEFRFLQAAFADAATPIGSVQGEPLYTPTASDLMMSAPRSGAPNF